MTRPAQTEARRQHVHGKLHGMDEQPMRYWIIAAPIAFAMAVLLFAETVRVLL